jgi:tetratricopeptide (TPR) repeat protein
MKKISFLTISLFLFALLLAGCGQEQELSLQERLEKADQAADADSPRKAIAEYKKVIEAAPGTKEAAVAHFSSGQEYYDMGRYDEAIAEYSKTIEIEPDNMDAYLMRGATYSDAGQAGPAIKDLTHYIDANPGVPVVYYIRGSVYLTEGDFDKAIEDFNESAKLDPSDPSYYYGRAIAYHDRARKTKSREDYEKAVSDLTKTIEINPEYRPAEVYKWRADSYNNLGKYPEAIADFTRAIELSPNDPVLYNDRGNAHLRSEQFKKAKEDYMEAIDLDSEGPIGQLAYSNLELMANLLQEKAQGPEELTQYDIDMLNSLEKEWGMNIDKSIPFIQERNYAGADVYIAKARESVQKMKDLLTEKRYDPESIDRIIAMDRLVMVYANLNRIGAYANNPEEAIGNMVEVQALFQDTHKQLNTAEAKFHEVPPLQELCREIRGLLNELEQEIKRYIM